MNLTPLVTILGKGVHRIMNSLTSLFNNVREETSKIPDRLLDKSWIEYMEMVEMLEKRNVPKARECMVNHLKSIEQTLKKVKGAIYDD